MRQALTQLDFSDEAAPENIYDATSRILKHFGDEGATLEDLCVMFQKNLTQWKPVSVSPALSLLIRVGCAREERNFGTRRVFHVKPFGAFELEQLHALSREAREEMMLKKLKAKAIAPDAVPALVAGTHVLGRDAAIAVQGAKMMFAIGKNNTVILEAREARELYEQLKAVFG
jgi:hypothetical protein